MPYQLICLYSLWHVLRCLSCSLSTRSSSELMFVSRIVGSSGRCRRCVSRSEVRGSAEGRRHPRKLTSPSGSDCDRQSCRLNNITMTKVCVRMQHDGDGTDKEANIVSHTFTVALTKALMFCFEATSLHFSSIPAEVGTSANVSDKNVCPRRCDVWDWGRRDLNECSMLTFSYNWRNNLA